MLSYMWRSPDLCIDEWQPLQLLERGGVTAALRETIANQDGTWSIAKGIKSPVIYVRLGHGGQQTRYKITGSLRPRYHVTLLGASNVIDDGRGQTKGLPMVSRSRSGAELRGRCLYDVAMVPEKGTAKG
jgi:hypothetical protein